MTGREGVAEWMVHFQAEDPERHALDHQPDWISDLASAHSSIKIADARKRGPSPRPEIELKILNTVSNEVGWHRIEATDRAWVYPHEHPPAGVSAALRWLRENVEVSDFRDRFSPG